MDNAHAPQPERLSTTWTPWLRNVVPPMGFVVLGVAAVTVALGKADPSIPALLRGVVLAVWPVISYGIFLACRSFREVWLDQDHLLVDDGQRRVRVPLREVTKVRQSHFTKTKTITLELSRNTPLGQKIRFVPHLALVANWMDHPVAKQLRERRERALAEGTGDGTG